MTDANTEQECAQNVKNEKPDATGATWQVRPTHGRCVAEYGNAVDSSSMSSNYRTCVFLGMFHIQNHGT